MVRRSLQRLNRGRYALTESPAYTLVDTQERVLQVWMKGFGDSSLDFELLWTTPEYSARPGAVL